MAKGMGGGIDFPPGSGKGIASVTQDEFEDLNGGAGGSPESSQERGRMNALLGDFAKEWSRSETVYADFLSDKIPFAAFDQYMDQLAEHVDRIAAELKKSGGTLPEAATLAAFVEDSRKAYGRYVKLGKSMLGQALKESDSIFNDIAWANAHIASLNGAFQGTRNTMPIEKVLEVVNQPEASSSEGDTRPSAIAARAGIEQPEEVVPAPQKDALAEDVTEEELQSDDVASGGKKVRRGSRGGERKQVRGRKAKANENIPAEPEAAGGDLDAVLKGFKDQGLPKLERDAAGAVIYGEDSIEGQRRRAYKALGKRIDQVSDGESIGVAGDRVRRELKARAPESEDMPPIESAAKVSKELFSQSPIDPLSSETTAAEVRGALENAVKAESERVEQYPDTPERARARLEGRAAREKAESAYQAKDGEYAAVEMEKKSAYFAALVKYQKDRGFLDVMGERTGWKKADQSAEPEELKALKKEWMQARLNRSRARLDAVLERRAARGATVEDQTAKSERADKVLERFQRRYLLREAASVAIAAANEESNVRAQALSERDRHVVEKIFKWTKDHPKFMLGISTAATLGGVITTAGSLATVPALTVLITAGAAVSAVNKWRAQGRADMITAESKRDDANAATIANLRAEQARLQKLSSVTTISGLSSLVAGGVARLFNRGGVQAAERDIASVRNIEIGDLRSENAMEAFEKLAAQLDAAYATKRQAEARVASASVVGGVVGGYGGGAALGALATHESVSQVANNTGEFIRDTWNDITHHESAAPADSSTAGGELKVEMGTAAPAAPAEAATKLDTGAEAVSAPEKAPEVSDAVAPAGSAQADAAPAAGPEASAVRAPHAPVVEGIAKVGTPEGLLVGATISQAGDGFGDMLVDLKHNFNDQLGSTIDTPKPALDYVLSTNVNEIAHRIGAAENGQSLTMHVGDQFVVDENQDIWFQPVNGDPVRVIENVPVSAEHPDGFVIHKLDTAGDMRVDAVPTAQISEPVSAPSVPSATVEAPAPITVEQPITGVTVDHNVQLEPGLKAPENLDTKVPAEPVPTAAPEAAPVAAPQYEVVGTAHPFAQPDAGPLLNPNGVDLNKPQILMNEGRYWALGTGNEDSYNRAVSFSQELSKTPGANTDVYFTVKEYSDLGQEYLAIRKVFTPEGSETPLMAPYGPGSKPLADLPDASKFTLPTKR